MKGFLIGAVVGMSGLVFASVGLAGSMPQGKTPIGNPNIGSCMNNNGLGFGDHWLENGQEFAKDAKDLHDDSICVVATRGSDVGAQTDTPKCKANGGLGLGDHWLQDGREFAKDSEDLSVTSICAVVRT